MTPKKLVGVPAAYGVAIGQALLHIAPEPSSSPEPYSPEGGNPVLRFEQAAAQTREELMRIQANLAQRAPREAEIFTAHLVMLEDPMLQEGIRRRIAEGESAAGAVEAVVAELCELFTAIAGPYTRERRADLEDIGHRILKHLSISFQQKSDTGPEKAILVAHELLPSDIAALDLERIVGFATDLGTATSHAAILARSLGIPGVVGLKDITRQIREGMAMIVDGRAGMVFLDPDEATLSRYAGAQSAPSAQVEYGPVVLLDGTRILVNANIGSVQEAQVARASGADGIGVVRTEFLWQDRDVLPEEEEQFGAYRQIVEAMEGQPVTIRTLDAGSDKPIPCLPLESEANPALGWRGIRISSGMPGLFRSQLRAILRASAVGPVNILFPMIATLEELREAKGRVESARQELRAEGFAIEAIGIGTMIEVPSAALIAEMLAEEADFLSIGTNDLIQYTFAADRTNPKVAYLGDGFHEAVVMLIERVAQAGKRAGKKVSVCGEMAADPEAVPLLLRLGIQELSMSPVFIPRIKWQIRQYRGGS